MANRRHLFNLTRHFSSSLSSNPLLPHHFPPISTTLNTPTLLHSASKTLPTKLVPFNSAFLSRHFCSKYHSTDNDDDEEEEEDEDDDGESEFEDEENDEAKSEEEIEKEAADIGYKVIGTLQDSERPFKPYEPIYAVVQVGAHQFKVSNGDTISTERLKYCDVNDKLILNKVLMLGSRSQTIIGRPILPNAAVHVVVEEHALDAKVLIFKKKRRKNYRRTNGHRQELTRLRIIDIQGIEKPENPEPKKKVKSASKKVEKVAVAA